LLERWREQAKKEPMKTMVGLWIPHRKAIIAAVTNKGRGDSFAETVENA